MLQKTIKLDTGLHYELMVTEMNNQYCQTNELGVCLDIPNPQSQKLQIRKSLPGTIPSFFSLLTFQLDVSTEARVSLPYRYSALFPRSVPFLFNNCLFPSPFLIPISNYTACLLFAYHLSFTYPASSGRTRTLLC